MAFFQGENSFLLRAKRGTQINESKERKAKKNKKTKTLKIRRV